MLRVGVELLQEPRAQLADRRTYFEWCFLQRRFFLRFLSVADCSCIASRVAQQP